MRLRSLSFRSLCRQALCFRFLVVFCLIPALTAQSHSTHSWPTQPDAPLTRHQLALQMLNRFTFGPRPGEVDAVMKQGPYAWFEQQLHPDSIPDTALDQRIATDLPSLYLPPRQLLVDFPSNIIIRQVAGGRRPYPYDPILASAYQVLVEKFNRRKSMKAGQNTDSSMMSAAERRDDRLQQLDSARTIANQVLAYPADQRMQAIAQLPLDQRITLTRFVPEPERTDLLNSLTPHECELFLLMAGGPDGIRVIDDELQQAKVLRAILSSRQLLEVMTSFWYNHFNVDIRKGADQWYTPTYERDAIRAHALGKFSDLLLATAQNPAMLWYLDNWSSVGPDSLAAQRARKKDHGINENYGREVMELHTVGVNGGYNQADVIALAKIMTGWTIDQPQQGGNAVFDPRKHEPGTIHWFGNKIKDNGYMEGRQALLWLAAQPQTAHHICYELAQYFVADDPPPSLVDRMQRTWMSTNGDISDVLRTMSHSPEFTSQRYYRNKVKTPLQFVASTFRATNTDPANPHALVYVIARMGEPLYQMQPPTGYPDTSNQWMNSGALVARLNFSMAFAAGRLGGNKFDAASLLSTGSGTPPTFLASDVPPPPDAPALGNSRVTQPVALQTGVTDDQALRSLENIILDGQVSAKTTAVIRNELASQQPSPDANRRSLDTITAMLLGSPEFQMH
ncbi:MAG TPA: DUF1800 domain-containing protein [Acidobacteriaceae bacterium]|nr:DUF1800 domain-containing protein [Acidobacteriaceae bacterium]